MESSILSNPPRADLVILPPPYSIYYKVAMKIPILQIQRYQDFLSCGIKSILYFTFSQYLFVY